ncbi:Ing5 protein [Cladochytrium replicatum]|nr:Ing5 protein [Cladochytrium replicatum]
MLRDPQTTLGFQEQSRRATTITGRSLQPQKNKLKRTKTNLASSQTATLSAEPYSSASSPERTLVDDDEMDNSPDTDEQLYCFCRQVSYGELIACDGEDCPNEWFHLECVGLTETPKGSWFCPDCRKTQRKVK